MTDKPKQRRMPVHEIFGPTIQGEGMVVGRKTMFVRTGGCDYSCAWCDSAFTWNGEEKATMMTAKEVVDELIRIGTVEVPESDGTYRKQLNFNHVTISGGNPALIRQPMQELLHWLQNIGIQVGLETQGSMWRDWFWNINDLTISPKPPSSLMKTNYAALDNIIEKLKEKPSWKSDISLKVVVFDDEDFEYAKGIHLRYSDVPFYLSVGNEDAKEQGNISQRLLRKLNWLWQKTLEDPEMNNAKPLPQLHTLVWANRRKV